MAILGIRREDLREELQGHVPVQLGVPGPEDLAHAALADLAGDAVVGDGFAYHVLLPPGQSCGIL